jgi:hypothetical protein
MEIVVSHFNSFILIPLGNVHPPQILKETEGAGGGEALWSIVIAADYDHRYVFFHKPQKAPLEDHQRLDLGADVMKDISGMDNRIRLKLNDLLDGLLESRIYHLFYAIIAMLIQAAVAGKAQVRIGQVNYLHVFAHYSKNGLKPPLVIRLSCLSSFSRRRR